MIKDTLSSYKTKFIAIYVVGVLIVLSLIYIEFKLEDKSDVTSISKLHFKNKFNEREEYFHEFFYPYFSSIKALNNNQVFKEFINNNTNKKIIENIFLQTKRSLPCLQQIRYIDKEGKEIIKVDGTPTGLYHEKSISKIASQSELKNKSNRYYFKDFIKLEDTKVGISKIDLNIENGKVITPKQPIIRFGIAVYDKNKKLKGTVVYNICLITFFKLINKTTLYHIHLVSGSGSYINHHNKNYGLLGEDTNYSLKDEFPNKYKEILTYNEYFGEKFYVSKISNFDNGQDLRLLLELKFDQLSKQKKDTENNFLILALILSALVLPLVIYLAKIPDLLNKKAKESKYNNHLTNLPNRLSLMQDLQDNKYENSIIILISLSNVIKIQNTYGHDISDELILSISDYLVNYDDKNIEKIYMNNYHVFSFKYKYTNDKTLNKFLKKFQDEFEHKVFKVCIMPIEFSVHTTIGISDPYNLNNSIDELQEAENALDKAIETKTSYLIYGTEHKKNIEQNRKNLLAAQEIKIALDKDSFVIFFQPIYNNKTKKIEKYECLVRMNHENEIKTPDKFLQISKDINKYELISYIVVEKSCRYFSDKDYEFSINLSILDIENIDFQKYLFDTIEKFDVSSKIVLEIVESEGIENYDEFFTFIKKAKNIGCKIAIDDFGTGYSNFEYIIRLSEYIDYLKIDGVLIKNIVNDVKNQTLVGSLKFLCNHLNIRIIAEYVENKETIEYLTYMGIEYSQGYFIGKPESEIIS